MTTNRLPHSRATVALTGGDDQPETPCAGRWFVYDILVDYNAGPVWREAVEEARAICGTCPLMATCLKANREEPWARAIIGRRKPTVSAERQQRDNQHRDERLVELRKLVAQGKTLEDALEHFRLNTRHQLYKWCHRHGHLDLWHALTPHLKANQHRRKSVAA